MESMDSEAGRDFAQGPGMNGQADPAEVAERLAGEEKPAAGLPPERMLPCCPHCGTDPARVLAVLVRLDERSDLAALVYYCGNEACRVIFSVAPLPLNPAAVADEITTAFKSAASKLPPGRILRP